MKKLTMRKKLWLGIIGLLMLLIPSTALAFDWSLKFEPGFAIALNNPQVQLFEVGGAGMIKALFGLGQYIDIGPTVGFLGLPTVGSRGISDAGTAWLLGGSLRFKRPYSSGLVSPWLDTDLLYVRTGPLDRLGLAVAIGVSFPVTEARNFWMGPFLRYSHIIQQPERAGYDNRDAKVLIAGLSFELGNSRKPVSKPVEPIVLVCPTPPIPVVCETCKPPPVCETCKPEPQVKIDETIQFDWDDFTIKPDMYSKLDNVVKIMKKDLTITVLVKGHASLEGQDLHNQTLSENRANSVLNYLVRNGIDVARISTQGFGSTLPLTTNDTLKGRITNRRASINIVVLGNGGKK